VCGINAPGHTCDEYLVLFTNSGMTPGKSKLLMAHCRTLAPERAENWGRWRRFTVNSVLKWSAGSCLGVGSKSGLRHS
jgi:hypothetical protein